MNPFESNTYGYLAYNDYKSAILNHEVKSEYLYNAIVIFCHQCIEKFLKHYIQEKTGETYKTHNLKSLYKKFIRIYGSDIPEIEKACTSLTSYYYTHRYPGEDYYDLDEEDIDEAVELIKGAKPILLKLTLNNDSNNNDFPTSNQFQ